MLRFETEKNMLKQKMLTILCMLPALALMTSASDSSHAGNFKKGPLGLESMGTLAFGPEGILFIGDSIGAAVVAIDLNDKTPNDSQEPLNVMDLEEKLAGMLGVDAKDVLVHDMAVNPISQNVYMTVSRGRAAWDSRWKLPNDVANADLLMRITHGGKIEAIDLGQVNHSKIALPNPINTEAEIEWKKTKLRTDAITDLAYDDGKLYVAGLSNEEFASTMRVIPFPFTSKVAATSLEIYHGAHGKYETHSPVRTFLPLTIKGKKHLLAAYLCTPLVTFPVDALTDKQHIKGRTVAELGFGNIPLDMVSYKVGDEEFVLLINSARSIMRFKTAELAEYNGSITTDVKGVTEGLHFDPLPGAGAQQLALLNSKNLLALNRAPNGKLNLESLRIRTR
jgi:hypothetical protein